MNSKTKLNIGAGNDIREGFVNHDIAALDGIDTVHDLNIYPWPWGDNEFEYIEMNDVLEHLDNHLDALEECHRILKDNGELYLKVPYWNSAFLYMDPTHKRGFHEVTFHFLDPEKEPCRIRPYYTHARFTIMREEFVLMPFAPYAKLPFVDKIVVKSKISKRLVGFVGNMFSNIILDLVVLLKKI